MRPTRNERESPLSENISPSFLHFAASKKSLKVAKKKGRKKGDCGRGKVREERALVAVKKYEEEEKDFYAESFPSQGGEKEGGREDSWKAFCHKLERKKKGKERGLALQR